MDRSRYYLLPDNTVQFPHTIFNLTSHVPAYLNPSTQKQTKQFAFSILPLSKPMSCPHRAIATSFRYRSYLHGVQTRYLPVALRFKFNNQASCSTSSWRRYECEVEAESPEKYERGVYFPVELGNVLKDGRYRIIHKLGWGGFATVWLARDAL